MPTRRRQRPAKSRRPAKSPEPLEPTPDDDQRRRTLLQQARRDQDTQVDDDYKLYDSINDYLPSLDYSGTDADVQAIDLFMTRMQQPEMRAFVASCPRIGVCLQSRIREWYEEMAAQLSGTSTQFTRLSQLRSAYRVIFGAPYPYPIDGRAVDSADPIAKQLAALTTTDAGADDGFVLNVRHASSQVTLAIIDNDPDATSLQYPNHGRVDCTAHLTLSSNTAPSWYTTSKDGRMLSCYIRLFEMESRVRGKGRCGAYFGRVLQFLHRHDVEHVTLVVRSTTPERACACYIRGAAKHGVYHLLDDANAVHRCANGYRLLFTRTDLSRALPDVWKAVDRLKQDSLSYVLRNYNEGDDD